MRRAGPNDLESIRTIYNEGIADRQATLDEALKTDDDIEAWHAVHGGRYAVLVAEGADGNVVGWASLNRYSSRAAYDLVAELSVYVARAHRGRGVGTALLAALDEVARAAGFHKIVLFAIEGNAAGAALYARSGYCTVGVFREHGTIEGCFVDVVAMEKLL